MGGIFETGVDIFFCQVGIILKDLGFCYSGGKKIKDKFNRYPGSFDDRIPP
jgi:hypothetical protein